MVCVASLICESLWKDTVGFIFQTSRPSMIFSPTTPNNNLWIKEMASHCLYHWGGLCWKLSQQMVIPQLFIRGAGLYLQLSHLPFGLCPRKSPVAEAMGVKSLWGAFRLSSFCHQWVSFRGNRRNPRLLSESEVCKHSFSGNSNVSKSQVLK